MKMKKVARLLAVMVGLYVCWLGMMAVHEAGHVLHAWLSGGRVERVTIPLLGFSQTFLAVNPRPAFVAWGGPVWGCVIPLILLVVTMRVRRPVRQWLQFFAGFCLVANGAYLGVGWTSRVGDAGDLLRHGTPVWVLVAFGAVAVTGGIYVWHRLSATGRDQTQDAAV